MIIRIAKINEEGREFTGTLPAELMDLEGDKFVRVEKAVRYRLHVSLVSSQLIVRGEVEVDAELLCVRCAELFSTKLRDSSFLRVYSIEPGTEAVDVSEDIREALLLAIPVHPSCEADDGGFCRACGRDLNEVVYARLGSDRSRAWDELDRLKL